MIKITQSGLKAIYSWDWDKECYVLRDNICPKQWKAKYIDKHRTAPSEAQMKGTYFEYAIGVNPDAQITKFPRKRGDKKYIDHERLDRQADVFRGICKEKGITLSNVQVELEHWHIADRVMLGGTMDILEAIAGEIHNIDVKVTSSLKHDFGEFQWSDPSKKDFIQAKFYDWLFFLNKGYHMKHLFLVFDYTPDMNFSVVHYNVTEEDHKHMEYIVDNALALIMEWHKLDYPAIPAPELCRQCPYGYKAPNKFEKKTLELNGITPMYGDESCGDRI